MNFCPHCGKKLSAGAGHFCIFCGSKLSSEKESAEETSGSQEQARGSAAASKIESNSPRIPADGAGTFSKEPPRNQLFRKQILIPLIAGAVLLAIAGGAYALMRSDGQKNISPQAVNSAGNGAVTSKTSTKASSTNKSSKPVTTPQNLASVPVSIADALKAQTGAGGVAATLGTYFWAINTRDWQTAWRQYTAEGQQRVGSVEKLAQGDATSNDSNIAIQSITAVDSNTLTVFVTFTSTQDAAYGPNGETCDNWTLDYTFKLVNKSWLIDDSKSHDGISSQPCNGSGNGALPASVGDCSITSISNIGNRLSGDPNSGSEIGYANGGVQVSYETAASVQDWKVGDRVELCLVSLPSNCPPGDDRGKLYKATNLRTNETWEAYDSEHMCGGA